MKDYEQISENCKMLWKEGFKITKQRYTQVSGYIFNDKNQLLVVKSKKTWTIPGGHPIKGETKLQSLKREVMEEALVTLKNVKYLGAVEVVENGETYYQLRYTAKVKEELPFNPTHETNERAFVDLTDYDLLVYKGKKTGDYDSKQRAFRMDTSDGDKDMEADFYVLKNTNCPAVLVECMFQDNKSDVEYLLSDAGKHSIMRSIIEGIISYINVI
jgi:ADP-ribose pyrophosphatase YjhB (NUDIX family)